MSTPRPVTRLQHDLTRYRTAEKKEKTDRTTERQQLAGLQQRQQQQVDTFGMPTLRVVDHDIADGTAPVLEKLSTAPSDEVTAEVDGATEWLGVAADEILLAALGRTIAAHGLSVEPFRDLLEAFRRDAVGETRRFATWADVLDYCRRSANPVGQLVLALFGHRDAARRERSDDICTALQLTNFWQDVAGDLDRGRVYLPEEDLERFSGSRDALAARRTNPAFRELLAFEIGRTRALFTRGLPLADMVGRRLRHEVRIFARGGLAILARIEAAGYDVFMRRPTLGRAELVRLVVRGLWR